jgi:hypothetical protein
MPETASGSMPFFTYLRHQSWTSPMVRQPYATSTSFRPYPIRLLFALTCRAEIIVGKIIFTGPYDFDRTVQFWKAIPNPQPGPVPAQAETAAGRQGHHFHLFNRQAGQTWMPSSEMSAPGSESQILQRSFSTWAVQLIGSTWAWEM